MNPVAKITHKHTPYHTVAGKGGDFMKAKTANHGAKASPKKVAHVSAKSTGSRPGQKKEAMVRKLYTKAMNGAI